ncbi:hypothetical protein IQ270_00775 [Microcoleus sp. LEGE 07076]|uniref:hypothetical protein n=1 Tax=Microcoleus sp. LEGE 07076 TaxID=915322 RepID=UPI001882E5BD|nr:hypothetical protein [Microcoleus sp. LEGE 07076]MBE9183294.1 hypothetical protein [Microcoleus sp. LEGE 07076]
MSAQLLSAGYISFWWCQLLAICCISVTALDSIAPAYSSSTKECLAGVRSQKWKACQIKVLVFKIPLTDVVLAITLAPA